MVLIAEKSKMLNPIGERHRYLCAVLKVGTMLIATPGMWIKKKLVRSREQETQACIPACIGRIVMS